MNTPANTPVDAAAPTLGNPPSEDSEEAPDDSFAGHEAMPIIDYQALHAEAMHATETAVRLAVQSEIDQLRDMGMRLKAEQDRLFRVIAHAIPVAVRDAASKGQRTADVLTFGGSDKFGEFCYLYMLKGPHKYEQRQHMRAMGIKPLIVRLRELLGASGFRVHHVWQRATNENSLVVSW